MFVRGDWTRAASGRGSSRPAEDAARAEGFRELGLMATLPGVLLYERFGFRRIRDVTVTMPDGVDLACVEMDRPID